MLKELRLDSIFNFNSFSSGIPRSVDNYLIIYSTAAKEFQGKATQGTQKVGIQLVTVERI